MSIVPIPKLPRAAAVFQPDTVGGVFSRETMRFPFEPWAIEKCIDRKRKYDAGFNPCFPLLLSLFSYEAPPPFPLDWHEHLEIFVPCVGRGKFMMADRVVPFSAGDVLVVDNLKLHGILQFQGEMRRGMVIGFLPQLVFGPGSPRCDSEFLAPFRGAAAVRADDPIASRLHDALLRLAACYFDSTQGALVQAGCKVHLLEILYLLAARLRRSQATRREHILAEERSTLLDKLHPFLSANLSERVTVARAASAVHMSESAFMKYFKRVTGKTFISYLTRMRLARAAELLEHTSLSVAEISYSVGFSDQSYFDRVFRRHFLCTPREVRRDNAPVVIPRCARRPDTNLHIS